MPHIRCFRARLEVKTPLAAIAEALREKAALAAREASAHFVDPAAHPAIDGLARLLVARVSAAARPRQASLRMRLAAGTGLQRRPTRAAPLLIGDRLAALLDRARTTDDRVDSLAAAIPSALELRVHNIRCVRDPGDGSGDELDLVSATSTYGGSGVAIADDVTTLPIGALATGQAIDLQRHVLACLPLDVDALPAIHATTLLLVERDQPDRAWLIDGLRALKRWAEGEVLARVAVGSDMAHDDLVAALPFALDTVLGPLVAWLGDDLFEPVTLALSVPSRAAILPGSPRTTHPEALDVCMRHRGEVIGRYQITADWHLA